MVTRFERALISNLTAAPCCRHRCTRLSSGSRRVASTSFDDTVRVWDGGAGLAPLMRAKHDNQTGRWVHPFRAVWGPATDCLIVGELRVG